MLGFKIDETMIGDHKFEFGSFKERPNFMQFSITWGPKNILKWLNPFDDDFMTQPLKGTITIEGLCEEAPCEGTLALAYHEGRIRYDIYFSVNGTKFEYVGEKRDIRPWNLHRTHTTCYGNLYARTVFGTTLVSKSTTHFRLGTLPKFLKSFRFVRR